MLHICTARFIVTENLKNFVKFFKTTQGLNAANEHQIYISPRLGGPARARPDRGQHCPRDQTVPELSPMHVARHAHNPFQRPSKN